ncbi:glutaredoxin 2 [Neisseria sp. S1]|uniref:glutaredoxin 2 n=1 Tax=Neisseria sp. S1 TaxID=3318354 RepID=UPI003A88F0F6
MKLYIYDHCPFCVRARMIFGLCNLPLEEVILQNDDEATPIALIGTKQVPILEKPDGTHMAESLDIVRFVNEYGGGCLAENIRPEIQQWFNKVNEYQNKLVQPRDVLLGLPEFSTQSAIDYFVKKKEKNIGNFQTNLSKTKSYLERLHQDLAELDNRVKAPNALNGEISMEDILIFPILRNLTMVRGLELPPKVQEYVETMSEQSKVPLFFDRAL